MNMAELNMFRGNVEQATDYVDMLVTQYFTR